MKQVIMLKGLPGSGKTTYAKGVIDRNPGQYKRISKDDLRSMFDNGRWSKANEKFVLSTRDQLISNALIEGKSVIVDDTNLHPKHEKQIKEIVDVYNKVSSNPAEFQIYDSFTTDPKECIKRDLKRPNSVGSDVIMGMYKRFVEKTPDEYTPDITLPEAVIFDIDGTLAIKGARSPYDWEKVKLDDLNLDVSAVLEAMHDYGYKIVLLSGRDSVCRKETLEWLEDNTIPFADLYMRPEGDTRKDFIVKKELFDQVAEKYWVQFVVDDRKQVVDMWRSIGLTCFQVAEGDF